MSEAGVSVLAMASTRDKLSEAVAGVREIWPDGDVGGLSDSRLVEINDRYGQMRRMLEADHSQIAAEIARRSRPDLGPDSLAKTQGYRNPTVLIAATTGTTNGEAARLVQVGEATAPRQLLSGETAPARHPHVAAAMAAARIGASAAAAIIAMLDRVALRAGSAKIGEAERILAEQAPGLSMDQLSRVLTRAEAWLDPDGVAPREDDLRAGLMLTIRQERDGSIALTGRFDPEHAAPILTAVEGMVTAELRAARDADGPDAVRRTVVQLQAEALARICEHALGCPNKSLPLEGATVIVRIDHDDLVTGTGSATIDGIAAPVSAATARRMAAGGQIISCLLGGDSQILDWGRTRRLYTTTQRLALVERDGGCAMCGAPPGHTKVHHIRWWARDAGPTDLANGCLLCESCHHRIHDNGWEIRIEGTGTRAKVWFIPPPHVDPDRTPRLGGRARYDFAA